MGNYDAIIIGHSQFERIPISDERQEAMLRKQIDDLEMAIQSARYEQDGGRYTVKQIVGPILSPARIKLVLDEILLSLALIFLVSL